MAKETWIDIEIISWEKYNPRTDRKKHSWFRLENTFPVDPKLHGLKASEKWITTCLFAEASKQGSGVIRVGLNWLSHYAGVKDSEIKSTIQQLTESGVVRLPTGNQLVSTGNQSVSTGSPTYVRTDVTDVTDERYERTDSQNQATADSCAPMLSDPLTQEILSGVKPEIQSGWLQLYSDAEWVRREIQQAAVWCTANPARKPKSDFGRFLTSWLARGWERYRKTLPANAVAPIRDYSFLEDSSK